MEDSCGSHMFRSEMMGFIVVYLNVTDAYRNMAGGSWDVTYAYRNVTDAYRNMAGAPWNVTYVYRNVTDAHRNVTDS
jgi:hypothetical protein